MSTHGVAATDPSKFPRLVLPRVNSSTRSDLLCGISSGVSIIWWLKLIRLALGIVYSGSNDLCLNWLRHTRHALGFAAQRAGKCPRTLNHHWPKQMTQSAL